MSYITENLPSLKAASVTQEGPALAARLLIYFSISVLCADFMYKLIAGITFQTKESCILYSSLPRWGFILYENFVELFLVVIAGIFAATLLEKYFIKLKRFVPGNCLTAFVYASIIPICACSAIPFIRSMENRIPFRAVITFVIAAPLLNPYIVMVSVTVLGIKYAILRIIGSLILAITTGIVAEIFYKKSGGHNPDFAFGCHGGGGCSIRKTNVFDITYNVFKKIAPFIAIAGILSFAVEMIGPGTWLRDINLGGGLISTVSVILAGVPIYFCNGADVVFLKPFIHHGVIPMGTAIAFSLTSTSICISSLVMLIKYVGKKLTFVILTCLVTFTIIISLIIQLLPFNFDATLIKGGF